MKAKSQPDIREKFENLTEAFEAMEKEIDDDERRCEISALIAKGQQLRGEPHISLDHLSAGVRASLKELGLIIEQVEKKLDALGLKERRLQLMKIIEEAYAEGNNPELD